MSVSRGSEVAQIAGHGLKEAWNQESSQATVQVVVRPVVKQGFENPISNKLRKHVEYMCALLSDG
jgi:hypothetical protein